MATEARLETAAPEGALECRNWFGELVTYPRALVEARSVDDVVATMQDTGRYPAPVRARGSAHSPTMCGEADGGTVVDMTGMNRILEVGPETVTAEAGALYIDVAKELERRDLQFYVNIEIGSATIGSLACCATKDASMPGELGQANSYCVGMKLVTAAGEIAEVTEDEPELLQAARSSYGLLGIVVEATFRIRPLQAMKVFHRIFELDEFEDELPELIAGGDSMMMYVYPNVDRIGVEFRRYSGEASAATTRANHFVWKLRNFAWKSFSPGFVWAVERLVPSRGARNALVNTLNWINRLLMVRVMKAGHTVPTDQIIRYPKLSGRTRFTFSMWALPEESYTDALREYFQFIRAHYERTGFRPNLLDVGYRVAQDRSSLFSYTWDGPVLTIDPVATGASGWTEFLGAFNEFCSERGGKPLFNQTWGLDRDHVRKAFGDRVATFEAYRRRLDPGDRLLNGYFRGLLGVNE